MEMKRDFRDLIVQQADAANRAMTSLFQIVHHRRPVADPFRSIMKAILAILVLGYLSAPLCATAADYSGTVSNKFGDFIGYTSLVATNAATGQSVPFTADRGGEFMVSLSSGTWTIKVDAEQVGEWGYAPLDNYRVTIDEGTNLQRGIVLFAREPLDAPELTFSIQVRDVFRFDMRGQGGTRLILQRSSDLKTWYDYYSISIAKPGSTFSINNSENWSTMFFRLGAATDP